MDFYCKAQYTGIGEFVRCLESKGSMCPFAEPLGSTFLCKSPHWPHFSQEGNITKKEDPTILNKVNEVRMIS